MKTYENRLRRMAERRGYLLSKSKRRDPKAVDYALFTLTGHGRKLVTSSLADIEKALDQ